MLPGDIFCIHQYHYKKDNDIDIGTKLIIPCVNVISNEREISHMLIKDSTSLCSVRMRFAKNSKGNRYIIVLFIGI